jgi:hypothetical protein
VNPPTILAVTLATIPTTITFRYILLCWVKPFGTCRFCHGTRVRPTWLTHRPRPCRYCKATGLRLRIGRRAYNRIHRLHHEGTR